MPFCLFPRGLLSVTVLPTHFQFQYSFVAYHLKLSLLFLSLGCHPPGGCHPLEGVTPHLFYLSDFVCPLFVNSATKIFSFGCHPRRVSPGAVRHCFQESVRLFYSPSFNSITRNTRVTSSSTSIFVWRVHLWTLTTISIMTAAQHYTKESKNVNVYQRPRCNQ